MITLEQYVTPQLQSPPLSLPRHIHCKLSGCRADPVHAAGIHTGQSFVDLEEGMTAPRRSVSGVVEAWGAQDCDVSEVERSGVNADVRRE